MRTPSTIWSSSDESIVKVSNKGVVTGVSTGSATITATTVNGLFVNCEVTVTKDTSGGNNSGSNGGSSNSGGSSNNTNNTQQNTTPGNGNSSSKGVFSDIKGHWAEDVITQFATKGIIAGYEDNSFKPNANITRAETVQILQNSLDYQKVD